MSQLPLSLSDRVPVVIAAMVSRSRHHRGNNLDRGQDNVIDDDRVLLKQTNKQTTNTSYTVAVTEVIQANAR